MIEKPQDFVIEVNRSATQLDSCQSIILKHIDLVNFFLQRMHVIFILFESVCEALHLAKHTLAVFLRKKRVQLGYIFSAFESIEDLINPFLLFAFSTLSLLQSFDKVELNELVLEDI